MLRTLLRFAALAALSMLAVHAGAAPSRPSKITVATDDNYPPFLFRATDGALQGIVKDRWDLWSKKTGVPVEIKGITWGAAQESVRVGESDVIEALAQTPARARIYEFPTTPNTIDARIFFHRSISGIKDAESLRGFTVGAKTGSACGDWLRTHGVESIREYANSERLVEAAGANEVRMFCMDSIVGQYFLVKHRLEEEFRQSETLYSVPFGWAVTRGRTELRDFIQQGFDDIPAAELAAVDARWRGDVVRLPVETRYLYLLLAAAAGLITFAAVVMYRNRRLKHYVSGRTAELNDARESLRKHAERAEYLATRDPLTDLPNRHLLHDRLTRTLAWAERNHKLVGVLFVDLDRFSAVNDTFGQEFGDELLKEVAVRLAGCTRSRDIVARISGDEFVLILPDILDNEASAIAAKVLGEIHHPYEFEGQRVYCTASIGVAVFPHDGMRSGELIRNADIAMDCAKENGRNNVQHYRPEMQHLAGRRLEFETALRGALDRDEFEVHYQPRVAIATGAISGFEALLRWRHPIHGLVSPAEFIPILEETGLIVAVGEWVIRRVCQQIKRWQEQGYDVCPVAVNLSARQLHQRDVDRVVAAIVGHVGIDPSLLELELTETALIREPEEAARTLHKLVNFGVKLAIDDFGTGYSSLTYLRRFPIAMLKVDRAFVHDVTVNPEAAAITQAIIQLAHSLGVRVVAEGVETESQREFLATHGCEEMQGYLYSPPVGAEEACTFLTSMASSYPSRWGASTVH